MTLHITIDPEQGTETVREEGGKVLGFIVRLDIGIDNRHAVVHTLKNGKSFDEAMDTRHALIRHGFTVETKEI
jgi:hypothetical protein